MYHIPLQVIQAELGVQANRGWKVVKASLAELDCEGWRGCEEPLGKQELKDPKEKLGMSVSRELPDAATVALQHGRPFL